MLTHHNDLARSGAASHEDILTPDNLKSGQFGFLGSVPLEGKIYAQPLYVEKAAVICSNEGATSVTNANIAMLQPSKTTFMQSTWTHSRSAGRLLSSASPNPAKG